MFTRGLALFIGLIAFIGHCDSANADDLPVNVANVMERLNQQVAQVERAAEAQIADVMRQVYAIEDEAAAEARELTIEAIDKLKMLQEQYTRDGQLDEAPLTFEELNKIKSSFTFTLLNMLHSRVSYTPQGEEPATAPKAAQPAT